MPHPPRRPPGLSLAEHRIKVKGITDPCPPTNGFGVSRPRFGPIRVYKDVMMKALLLANPQAFYKSRMDQMKEGAILRIPSLSEIVKHTGSKEAKQLLEQHSSRETTSSKLSTPISDH